MEGTQLAGISGTKQNSSQVLLCCFFDHLFISVHYYRGELMR